MQLPIYPATPQEQAFFTCLFGLGTSDPRAMHSVEWVKKHAKMVINCRTKSQSNGCRMVLGAGRQVVQASERKVSICQTCSPTPICNALWFP